MSKFAVIKTGGKQYKVLKGTVVKIEKIPGKVGDKIEFDQVLMMADALRSDSGSPSVEVGKPVLEGKKVVGKILEQGRSKKVLVVKYKPKVRYLRRKGHRQCFTRVEIQQI